MRHALTTHFRLSNFNTTLFADNTAVLHALIFTAQAFVVFGGAKDFCTE